MRSAATPLASNHTMPSVAVLPEPTITKSVGASASVASSWMGTTATSAPTPKGGGVVAGTVGDR